MLTAVRFCQNKATTKGYIMTKFNQDSFKDEMSILLKDKYKL